MADVQSQDFAQWQTSDADVRRPLESAREADTGTTAVEEDPADTTPDDAGAGTAEAESSTATTTRRKRTKE